MENQETNYNSQKTIFDKLRKKYDEIFSGRNTIDKLMRDKVDDYFLMEEYPLPIKIGARTLWVGNLNITNCGKFLDMIAQVMACKATQLMTMDVLSDASECYRVIMLNKEIRKAMEKILKKTILSQQWYYNEEFLGAGIKLKIKRFSYRYFKRYVTPEKLSQIIYLVYQYNFDAEKKNFKIMADKMGVKQNTETYIYSWLQNLVGLTGNFVKPQYQKSDSSPKESASPQEEKVDQNNKD